MLVLLITHTPPTESTPHQPKKPFPVPHYLPVLVTPSYFHLFSPHVLTYLITTIYTLMNEFFSSITSNT
jgi:hypothetical protein